MKTRLIFWVESVRRERESSRVVAIKTNPLFLLYLPLHRILFLSNREMGKYVEMLDVGVRIAARLHSHSGFKKSAKSSMTWLSCICLDAGYDESDTRYNLYLDSCLESFGLGWFDWYSELTRSIRIKKTNQQIPYKRNLSQQESFFR